MNNTKRETVRKTIEQSDTILGKCGKFHNGINQLFCLKYEHKIGCFEMKFGRLEAWQAA